MCPALSITNPEPSDCCCSFCGANVFPKNGSCGTFTIAVDVICTTPGAQRLYTSWIDSALLPEKDAGALEGEPVEFLGLKRRFPALIARARQRLAAYVGASASDIVLVPNATIAVNAVARSLDLAPGDEIVATTHEYGGNELLWEYVCERRRARYAPVHTLPARA